MLKMWTKGWKRWGMDGKRNSMKITSERVGLITKSAADFPAPLIKVLGFALSGVHPVCMALPAVFCLLCIFSFLVISKIDTFQPIFVAVLYACTFSSQIDTFQFMFLALPQGGYS